MLGVHSPVIMERYIKAGILDIDAIEFSHGTMQTFVEAMYCGIFEITKENFRELNKLCHVFEVTWMLSKCREYFEGALDKSKDSEDDLGFLFEEAVYFSEQGKSITLLHIWKGMVGKEKWICFVGKYFSSSPTVSEFTLKCIVEITEDHSVFVRNIRDGLNTEPNTDLNRVSKYLLLNINFIRCLCEHKDEVFELFDVLLENENSSDWKVVNKLYRRVSKDVINHQAKRIKVEEEISVYFPSRKTLLNQDFPNLFHSLREVANIEYGEYENSQDAELDIVLEATDVSCSLYMLLEYMENQNDVISDSVIKRLPRLRKEKGWGPVHPQFICNLDSSLMPNESKRLLGLIPGITSDASCVRVVSEVMTTPWKFVTQSALYKFHMDLSTQFPCDKESQCGFIIEVNCLTRKNPQQFDIKLVLDADKYPAHLHCHYNLSAADMHFVLENRDNNSEWESQTASWNNRPSYDDTHVQDGIEWGGLIEKERDTKTRLVVYYSVGANNRKC